MHCLSHIESRQVNLFGGQVTACRKGTDCGQGGTCAQDLEQLVNHFDRQFGACSSSAPEVPAIGPSFRNRVGFPVLDSIACTLGRQQARLSDISKKKEKKSMKCERTRDSSLRHTLKLNSLTRIQVDHHAREHLPYMQCQIKLLHVTGTA